MILEYYNIYNTFTYYELPIILARLYKTVDRVDIIYIDYNNTSDGGRKTVQLTNKPPSSRKCII